MILKDIVDSKKRREDAISDSYHCIFPGQINHYQTLFGGQLLSWMDELAFIVATRFCRKKVATISVDHFEFKKPIEHGTILILRGEIVSVGKKSLKVKVSGYKEEMTSEDRELCAVCQFSFALAKFEGKKA